jgi:hypothetical protein
VRELKKSGLGLRLTEDVLGPLAPVKEIENAAHEPVKAPVVQIDQI